MPQDPNTTEELGKTWAQCEGRVAAAKKRLSDAFDDARNAAHELGAHLDPGDMKQCEQIGVWVRLAFRTEACLVVTRQGPSYQVARRGQDRRPAGGADAVPTD
jgi:hypothetical protein